MQATDITGKRIKMLRTERKLSQQEFSEAFAQFMNKANPMSIMTISAWESGRKLPPYDTIINLAMFFGVSLDYLSGFSDIKTVDGKASREAGAHTDIMHDIEIPYAELSVHDQEPVFVEFPTKSNVQFKNGWALLDYSKQVLVFTDHKVALSRALKYYEYIVPYAITIKSLATNLLNLGDVMNKECVYIESLSPDPSLRAEISGWYYHNPDKTFLINKRGYALSYDGLGVTYNAVDYKTTKKVVKDEK